MMINTVSTAIENDARVYNVHIIILNIRTLQPLRSNCEYSTAVLVFCHFLPEWVAWLYRGAAVHRILYYDTCILVVLLKLLRNMSNSCYTLTTRLKYSVLRLLWDGGGLLIRRVSIVIEFAIRISVIVLGVWYIPPPHTHTHTNIIVNTHTWCTYIQYNTIYVFKGSRGYYYKVFDFIILFCIRIIYSTAMYAGIENYTDNEETHQIRAVIIAFHLCQIKLSSARDDYTIHTHPTILPPGRQRRRTYASLLHCPDEIIISLFNYTI